MGDPRNRWIDIQRSRRNLMKIGTIAASAMIASIETKPAHAGGGNQGGNNQGGNRGGPCFLRGTTIQTADGDKRIEDLAVGDLLPTVFGGMRPIQWIGRYHFKKPDPTKPWVKDILPIRVARSALGPDMPHTDLFVTKAHALLLDEVLVHDVQPRQRHDNYAS
jgi:hypothetical protein